MKILVCGSGKSAFLDFLVSRFNKEKHEVFVLVGNKNESGSWNKGVFQKYAFSYTDDGVARVIGNISPDIVVFLGAMDSNFEGEWEREDIVEYSAGLTNLLLCAKNSGAKKFVYISSMDIYDGNKENVITNDTRPKPASDRSKAIIQGEESVRFYKTENFDTYVLRLGNVYGGFGKYIIKDQVVENLLKVVEENTTVECRTGKTYFVTALPDAIDAVCRVAISPGKHEQIEAVPGINVEEKDIVQELADIIGKNIEIQMSPVSEQEHHLAFETTDIYTFRLKYNLHQGLEQFIKQRNNSAKEKKRSGKTKKTRKKLDKAMPFVETLVAFLIIFVIQTLGNDTWLLDTVDFYLLYVVLIAAVHGTNCGLIALVLSALAKFWTDIGEHGLEIVAMDYTKYLWVLQLLIVGVLIGFMRDKYRRKTQDLEDDLLHCRHEISNLEEINESNVYVKGVYEKRLVNYKNSMARIYEITSQLDIMDSRRVAFKAVDVIKEIMDCEAVSIYTRSGEGPYFRLLASNTPKYKTLGKSFCYKEGFQMYEMLEEEGMYQNQKMEESLPIMAGAIKDKLGTQTIVMIWSLDLKYTNQYQVNLFKVLNRLIEKSLTRANQYMEEMYQKAYFIDTKVMNAKSMENIIDIYSQGMERGVFEYALLKIEKKEEKVGLNWLEYLDSVQKMLRENDIVGIDKEGNGMIILGASGKEDAQHVKKRLEEKNIHTICLE